MPATAQAPRETSAGIAHAQPNGDQPATMAITTPKRASPTNARSRNRREARNEAKAAVAARDNRKQVITPSGAAISAAIVSGRPRAQVITRPAATTIVATPGALVRPATRSPGSRSEARTGSNANLAGSMVSSTPKTSIDISSQPTVRPAYPTTVRSAVSASDVKRRPINPASTKITTPSA